MAIKNQLPRSSPEAQGIPSSAILAFVEEVEQNGLELHSLMLLRHGHVAAEGWWLPYGPEHPHVLFSLSKSFTSTAVGLAAAEGRLSVSDPVCSFFPEDVPAEVSANLDAMRVRHLLSMSTGHVEDTLDYLFQCQDRNWIKAFLERPVEREPGTHFLYNSGASYMLSAIVQKVTGTRLLDYLQPRLFAPLGIEGATWETCPRGINTGGWGLSVKTEDIARFGQMYLHKGVWNGQRILPEAWVEEATSRQVSNGSHEDSDWEQGYGYQFWRCRHGVYRGDGAFGQFCIVMPDQDAVVAITSGVGDMQAVLNLVWKHLLPAMGSVPLSEDPPAHARLVEKLTRLTLALPQGQPVSPIAARVSGQKYVLEANEQKVEAVSFDFGGDKCRYTFWDGRGEHSGVCSSGLWLKGTSDLEGGELPRVAASGAWTAEDMYTIRLCFYETPFCSTITCRFTEDKLLYNAKANVAFGPTEGPQLVGRPADRQ